ncbi:MAG: hypothetical protein MZV49_26070 [Rhodopseudomonas palustris]|nr:hypothetical protein [Rhodopseudomonas palustris]
MRNTPSIVTICALWLAALPFMAPAAAQQPRDAAGAPSATMSAARAATAGPVSAVRWNHHAQCSGQHAGLAAANHATGECAQRAADHHRRRRLRRAQHLRRRDPDADAWTASRRRACATTACSPRRCARRRAPR